MGGHLRERDDWLVDIIRQGQAEGTFAADLSPEVVSRYCLMLLLGSILLPAAGLAPIDEGEWAALMSPLGRRPGRARRRPEVPREGARRRGALRGPRPLLRAGPRAVRARRHRQRRRASATAPSPPARRTPPAWPSPTAPSWPSRIEEDARDATDDRFDVLTSDTRRAAGHRQRDRRRPVADWATDFDHTDERVGRRPVPDLGRPAAAVPGRPHRPLRRRVAADPPRGRGGHRLRHRALHVAQRRR